MQRLYIECLNQPLVYTVAMMAASFPGLVPAPAAVTAAYCHSWIRERFLLVRTDDLLTFVSPCSTGATNTAARLALVASSNVLKLLSDAYPGLCTINFRLASVPEVRELEYIRLNGGTVAGVTDPRVLALNAMDLQLDAERRRFNTLEILSCAVLPNGEGPVSLRPRALYDETSNALPSHEVAASLIDEDDSRFLALFRANLAIHSICILSMALGGMSIREDSLSAVPSHISSQNTIAYESDHGDGSLLGKYQSVVQTASECHLDGHVKHAFATIADTFSDWGGRIMEYLHMCLEQQQGWIPDFEWSTLLKDVVDFCIALSSVCEADGALALPNRRGTNSNGDAILFGLAFNACLVRMGAHVPGAAQTRRNDPAWARFMDALQTVMKSTIHTARSLRAIAGNGNVHICELLPHGKLYTQDAPEFSKELVDQLQVATNECLKRRYESVLLPYLMRNCNLATRLSSALVDTFPAAGNSRTRISEGCNAAAHRLTTSPAMDYRMQNTLNDTLDEGSLLPGTIRAESNVTTSVKRRTPCYSALHDITLPNGVACRVSVSVNTIRGDVTAGSQFVATQGCTNVLHVILSTSEEGRRQYQLDLASLPRHQVPPNDRIRHVHWDVLNPCYGVQQRQVPHGPLVQNWCEVCDIDFSALHSGFQGSVTAQFIHDTTRLNSEPVGVNVRVFGFRMTPSPLNTTHSVELFIDDVRNYELFTDDTLSYGDHYSELLHASVAAITQRSRVAHGITPAAQYTRVFPGPFVPAYNAGPGAVAVRHISVIPFRNAVLNHYGPGGFTPLSVRFMRDLSRVRPAEPLHRDNAASIGGHTVGLEAAYNFAHCAPLHWLTGINGGGGAGGAYPIFDADVVYNPANYHGPQIDLMKQRMLWVSAFGYLNPANVNAIAGAQHPWPGAPPAHLTHLLHGDIGSRICSLGELLGLFDVINHPRANLNANGGGSWPSGPGTPLVLTRLHDSIGRNHPQYMAGVPPRQGPVVCISTGPASASHDTLSKNDATHYTALDTLVMLALLSFASSTVANPAPLCVFIPPDTGSGMPSLDCIRQSLHTRLVSLLTPQERHANAPVGNPVPLTNVVQFVDFILTHISLTDIPDGVIVNGLEMYVPNVILTVGGSVSTNKGMTMLRRVREAKHSPSSAIGGYPTANSRHQDIDGVQDPLEFRTVYFTVRGTLRRLRLSGFFSFFLSWFFFLH